MRKKKRLTSLCALGLCVLLVVQPMVSVFAAKAEPTLNIDLLEAMLNGNRSWVIDTLVEDDWSTSPMNALISVPDKSMARTVMDNYYGIDVESKAYAAIYRLVVDAMEKWYNKDEYIEGFAKNVISELLDGDGNLVGWAIGWFADAFDLEEKVDALMRSTDEMRYDSLLKAVYTATYTSSNGDTLGEQQQHLTWMRELKDVLGVLENLTGAVEKYGEAQAGKEETQEEKEKAKKKASEIHETYVEQYAKPYGDALGKFIDSLDDLGLPTPSEPIEANVERITSLAAILQLSMVEPVADMYEFSYLDFIGENVASEDVLWLLEKEGKTLDFMGTCMDTYLFVDSIQTQRDGIIGPLERIAATTDYKDMRPSVEHFIQCMGEQFNNQMYSFDSLVEYVRSENVVGANLQKLIKKSLKKSNFFDVKIAGATTVGGMISAIDLGAWLSDVAVDFEDTCKKTYELRYWEKLLNVCLEVYENDLAAYQANKTEENAKKVLDDLLAIQRMRLYGEKTAYEVCAGQMSSPLGLILGGGSTVEAWETQYQYGIDIIMAAGVIPSYSGITVAEKESLWIRYDESVGYTARKTMEDGSTACYVDLDYRLMGGVTVDGTCTIVANDDVPLVLGYLEGRTDSTINIIGPVVAVELAQCGGTINMAEKSSLKCIESLELEDATLKAPNTKRIPTKTLTISGDVTANGAFVLPAETLNLYGDITASGNLDLDVSEETVLLGDTSLSNVNLETRRFAGSSDLYLYNSDLNVERDMSARSLNGDSNSSIRCGDASFGGAADYNGVILSKGDFYARGGYFGNITLCGTFPQIISGNTFRVGELSLENTSRKGVELDCTIYVDKRYYNAGDYVIGTGSFWTDKQIEVVGKLGNLTCDGVTLTGAQYMACDITVVNGMTIEDGQLTATGTITVDSGEVTLTGESYMLSKNLFRMNDAVLCVGMYSQMELQGQSIFTDSEICGEGTIRALADMDMGTCTIDGGIDFIVGGDFLAPEGRAESLTMDGRFGQRILGRKLTLDRLELNSRLVGGVTLETSMTVVDNITTNGVPFSGTGLLTAAMGVAYDGPITDSRFNAEEPLTGDLVTICGLELVDGEELILQGCTLVVGGDLTCDGGSISVDADSRLIVKGSAVLSNMTVTISGSWQTERDVIANATKFTLNGDVEWARDAVTVGGSVSGKGALTVGGDLMLGSKATIGKLYLSGRTRQTLSGGVISVTDVILDNPSKAGITLNSKITYSGSCTTGETRVVNGDRLVAK